MQPTRREKMIERGLILTGQDAELLSQVLEEVKTKVYAESEASLDNSQALDTLVSYFRSGGKAVPERGSSHTHISPLSNHLVLGTIIGRHGGC
jgi:hypothetical protein